MIRTIAKKLAKAEPAVDDAEQAPAPVEATPAADAPPAVVESAPPAPEADAVANLAHIDDRITRGEAHVGTCQRRLEEAAEAAVLADPDDAAKAEEALAIAKTTLEVAKSRLADLREARASALRAEQRQQNKLNREAATDRLQEIYDMVARRGELAPKIAKQLNAAGADFKEFVDLSQRLHRMLPRQVTLGGAITGASELRKALDVTLQSAGLSFDPVSGSVKVATAAGLALPERVAAANTFILETEDPEFRERRKA